MHYSRWRSNGDPSIVKYIRDDATARFWSKVNKDGPGGCWLWTAAKDGSGYGQFRLNGGLVKAHRHAYQTIVGPIPDGLVLDHLCRVRHCCNPAHLEPVTHRENILRGEGIAAVNAAKTHCMRGHEFTSGNTYLNTNGGRGCRACLG